jgi:IS4 transposase
MNKSSFSSGQPIFTQLIKFISRSSVNKAIRSHNGDRYCKKFNTWHHLIAMLYCCYQHCTSLREVVSGMAACEGRLQSAGIIYLPARSTLADANKHRSYKVFEDIYQSLYGQYHEFLSDSRSDKLSKRMVIIDSTTISLFQEILKGAGCPGLNGKKKGGIKVHTAIRANEGVPYLTRFSPGAGADVNFLKDIHLPKGSIIVMDRGYKNYKKFHEWNQEGIYWVTRLQSTSVYEATKDRPVKAQHKTQGIISDQDITLGFKNKKIQQVKCRLVRYYDEATKREFTFITNNRLWSPVTVAEVYKRRWQIELLFKRYKQNMPLLYFLGDNENAIKVQIYCALIADLLLKVATKGIKRKWAFSNLASIVRLHLMNYTNLVKFLEQPEKCRIINPAPSYNPQLQLNLSG